MYAHSNAKVLLELANAVIEGKLVIPIAAKKPLKDASEAHALVANGVNRKVLMVS